VLSLLLPDRSLCLDRVEITAQAVSLSLRTTSPSVPCPLCAQPARQVHSRYTRHARDLPIHGWPTVLRLSARRFFCRNVDCPRRVFCEPLPQLLPKHARATSRLSDTHRAVGLALGGEPGARLAGKLGMPTSPDTLLRRLKQLSPTGTAAPAPRVIGVDDWALRKGQTYGTIIIDLERSAVLELLPGRDGAQLKTWLGQHPEVEILTRDRWACFAEAVTEAAPQAKQVADRWHLLKNLREALERFLQRFAGKIAAVFAAPAPLPTDQPLAPAGAPPVPTPNDPPAAATPEPASAAPANPPLQRPLTAKQQRRLQRYQEVRRRHAEGQSLRSIALELGLSRGVVQRYVQSDHCPDWRPGRGGPSQADGYRARIDSWLATRNRNISELHRQLQAAGATLSYDALRCFVRRRLAARGELRERVNSARPAPPGPAAKALSFAVLARTEKRTEKQQIQVSQLRAFGAEVAEAVGLVEAFAALVRKEGGSSLEDWQEQAQHGSSSELRTFAEGLARDQEAVQAALQERWSNGPVEGHINRLKTVKRQMYGRASLRLLRARVLDAG
jgi:transposase